jgi:hypothetical protein
VTNLRLAMFSTKMRENELPKSGAFCDLSVVLDDDYRMTSIKPFANVFRRTQVRFKPRQPIFDSLVVNPSNC